MIAYLQSLVDFLAVHRSLAYGAAFILSMAESIPVIGTLVPGSTVLIALGALVPLGAIDFWALLGWAVIGAVVGDGASFWLGQHFQRGITTLPLFRRRPALLTRGTGFFRDHGGKSVFLARFVAPVRAIVPVIAGMMGMPARQFYLANIGSALTWAPLHLIIGVAVGASLTLAGAVAGRLAVLLVLVGAVLWAAVAAPRFALARGLPLVAKAGERLTRWARAGNGWGRRQILSLLDPERSEARVLALLAGLLIAAAWIFFAILEDVMSGDPLLRADLAVYRLLQGLRTPWADQIMVAVTELGDGVVTIAVTLSVFAWLAWKRAWHTAVYWLAAIGFALAFTMMMKVAVHVARPVTLYAGTEAGAGVFAFAFPSGHVAINATLYGFLAFLIARRARGHWRGAVIVATALGVALIAFSRLYLGAHWFSDAAGGLAFALAWLAVLAIAYLRHRPEEVGIGGLAAVAAVALIAAGGLHIATRHHTDMARYGVHHQTREVTTADWWRTGWRKLPAHRIDLAGELEEPLTVQWAGSLESLQRRLHAQGWTAPPPWTSAGLLLWLAPDPDPLKLPVLARLHDGRPPNLVLVHKAPAAGAAGSRLVLQLWSAEVRLRGAGGNTRPLWIGTVVTERLSRPFSFLTLSTEQPGFIGPRRTLAAALAATRATSQGATSRGITTRLAQRPIPPRASAWDGRVLLAYDGAIGPAPGRREGGPR